MVPRFVVTRITPLAASAPYIAADASFKTLMDSISFGLRRSSPSLLATPSIIIRGELSLRVPLPRMYMFDQSDPGSPERVLATTPGICPANVFVKEYGDIKILEEAYADEEYGIAVSKDNPELLQRINEALDKLQSEGEIDRIVKAWIEDGETVSAYDGQTKDSYSGGTLLMLTNAEFPPYEDKLEDGTIVGIDIDIMKAICDELDMKLQVEHTSFDSLLASLQRGTGDVVMAAMTINEERLEQVNFSNIYMSAKQVIIIRSK